MEVKIKKMNERAHLPTFGTDFSAGADLYCAENGKLAINSGETVFLDTGIAMEIPDGYVGLVFARSGLACKHGLRPANCVGVIDSDYRNSIKVALHNDGEYPKFIDEGERIAQIIILPYPKIQFAEVEEISDTTRGLSGFGGTGRF